MTIISTDGINVNFYYEKPIDLVDGIILRYTEIIIKGTPFGMGYERA
jgi:hypothetical protein